MAIKNCKECDNKVSTSAKVCPYCGKRNPTGGLTVPAKLFLLLLVIGGFAQVIGTSQNTQTQRTVTSSSNQPHQIPVDPVIKLTNYGKKIASSSQKGALNFIAAIKTTESPMRAYKIQFQTSAPELMNSPNADKDSRAYLTNVGTTKLWETKFCTDDLKKIMAEFGIDLVSGDLQNMTGDTQSMSACFK